MKFFSWSNGFKGFWAAMTVLPVALLSGCATYDDPKFSDTPQSVVATTPSAASESNGSILSIGERDDKFTVGDFVTVTFSGVGTPPQPHEEQVKSDGNVTLPLIGAVKAEGKSPGELQLDIYNRYVPKYYTVSSGFTVTVKPKERVYYVGGEVKMPGPKMYLGKTTVTKAIQTAGDFTDFANKRSVKLTRADGTKLTVNCNKAIGNPALDPPVFPGDQIHVKRRIF
ncbi:MAG TPA: polysaccharide biosynthesis/export family protein [Verrucomicrobiota bacterium]|nr:polysaccharide biosynthesis/export family protein [Verrucomicrobiota bacterium]